VGAVVGAGPGGEGGWWVGGGGGAPGGGPPAAPLAGVAAAGPDVLRATKLHLPRPSAGFVPRPRLTEALSDGLARGRVCVCAPAGFGKTGLLAEWVQGSKYPVVWLCLDAGDSDPARFWRYALAAL